MKLLTTIKNKLFTKHQIVQLGRWNIDYCQKKINKKINLSNEDHCGTCNNKYKEIDIKKLIFYETM